MTRPAGNTKLKSARVAAGYPTQQVFAEALGVGVRQVRRWESDNPPWPHPDLQQRLMHLTGQDLENLGFIIPPGRDHPNGPQRHASTSRSASSRLSAVPSQSPVPMQPASVAADYASVTRSHRGLYWSVTPATLHPAVIAHADLGCALLPGTAGQTRRAVAAALAETWLLAGRIEFFDLREPDDAGTTLLRALQAASEAEDSLIGSAILAHTAFIPGWAGDHESATEHMVAARAYARRGPASAELWAWLDAVEAECETRCGNTRTALHLIRHAEDTLTAGSEHMTPAWMDWFDAVRLAAFKGHTQFKAGHLPQARATLLSVLDHMSATEDKQRTVIFGDLAAVEAAAGQPEEACRYACLALDQLEVTWYATGMDRVREVRRALTPHQHARCVRDLDDRLYGWTTTVSALAR
ncbi:MULTISPECIES: helix-turn-helix transcriptional regulator [unclassified Streptomyces]|uniref:helix-turn-helix domain-containing protein n=1 Tax=unclassified Streptomyces TaxID=2593676 RepID=UPI000890F6CD|nr:MULTISPECIES: helix-turn-helix transcriptional regulator [unclassified Streptomyces]PBC86135.1 transcriptional regulator with XRE-family HTH domain [Streptomyces sp. 2321.6]SDQ95197.1 Transcriptional regulator, contains XRE-family HTH domain [Streptomyces sp. KS_16]SED89330.1 Transcriptional regulator, contains XRE-family HTH domain [Streptomyces sp. 2133.1]SNC73015.1 Transcriptional regulator, contains XRE-family HTH domain [Streptomyces sp. 2114.4]